MARKTRRDSPKGLSIGNLAKRSGVSVDTIRFYEKQALIDEPARRESSGYRVYEQDAIRRIRFIRRAQELGFALREVKELLSLRVRNRASCTSVKTIADAKLVEINRKLHDLMQMKKSLSKLSASCAVKKTTTDCPILNCFEAEEISNEPN